MIFKKKKNYLNLFLKKNYSKFFIIFLICVIMFLLGSYAHKTHFFYTFAKPLVYQNVNFLQKIIKGKFQEVERVNLNINFKNFKQLNEKRELFIKNQFIDPKINTWIPISINHLGKNYKAKIRFKGREPDPHLNPTMRNKNWSFKIKFLKNEKGNILGMRIFSLMDLRRRGYLLEWYARKFLKEEKLIFLDYKFINLFINGTNHGIYVMDENISESALTKNNRRDSVSVKLDNNYVSVGVDLSLTNILAHFDNVYTISEIDPLNESFKSFKEKFILENKKLKKVNIKLLEEERLKNFYVASIMLDKFRRNELKTEDVFDIDQLAKGFAASDVLDGWHGINWTNMNFYLNPISIKLEPIFQDWYNEGSISTGHEDLQRSIRFLDVYNYGAFYKNIFLSKKFVEKYIFYLEKYTSEDYIKKFDEKIKNEFNKNLNIIYKSSPYYEFPKHLIERKIKRVKNFIEHYDPVHLSLWSQPHGTTASTTGKAKIKLGNKHVIPIIVEKIIITDPSGKIYEKKINLEIEPRSLRMFTDRKFNETPVKYKIVEFEAPQFTLYESVTIEYHLVGSKKKFYKKINRPIEYHKIDTINLDDILIFSNKQDTAKNFKFIKQYSNEYVIKKGVWNIDENLIIPKDKKLIISAGTTIILKNKSKIISNSPIIAKGTYKNKINIKSLESLPGQCIIIMNSLEKSIFYNVNFENLENCKSDMHTSQGSFNVYKSSIEMNDINFQNNIDGDDAINFIDSEFKLKNIKLKNIYRDGIDLDFSHGQINNLSCDNCGNDGIDISNTTLKIDNYTSSKTYDKGISIGENSILEANNINISDALIGIAVKDGSIASLNNLRITGTEYPIAGYIKKETFGPATINIKNLNFLNNKNQILLEKGTYFEFDNAYSKKIDNNVYKKIYP